MTRRLRGAALLMMAIVAAAPSASAETSVERAARLFDEGGRAFEAGAYRRAAVLFEEAYALAPHPSSLVNAAQARARAGDDVLAANHYARLAEDPAPREREEAHAALAAYEPSLARVVVTADDATLDGAPVTVERIIWVAPGEHAVEGHVHGTPAHAKVDARRGRLLHVTLTLTAEEHPDDVAKYAAYGLGGATVIAAGITAWSGLDVLAQKTTFDRTGEDRDLDEGLARQQRTNILLGVTVVLAVATGIATYFALRETPSWSPHKRAARGTRAMVYR